MYYDDHGCIVGDTCPNLATAISTFNTDFKIGATQVAQWAERTTQTTYVDITLSGTGGRGDVDSIGFPGSSFGPISLNCNTDCNIATLLHEMGHIVGLYHEHVRTDRDSYVTVNYDNVIKGSWVGNFAIQMQNQQLLSPYDYASVMQYPSLVDTRNGAPVIETIPPGIPLQGTEGVPGAGNQDYSAGDKEAILRLYGSAPTMVTVTSNPVGLQVIVDTSTTCTTPCTYSWSLGSSHTVSVADGVQTLTGDIENSTQSTTFYYTFGRWSDSGAQTHTVSIQAGSGSPAFPTSAPAIATYTANFIQLVPYTDAVSPSASGSVSVSPQPQTYSGASGDFFVARQQATLTATPASTYNFYEFNEQSPYFWLSGGLSANPKTFFVPDTGNPVAVNAEFTTSPVYTVNVVPADPIANDFSSGLFAYVDGGFWVTPKSFSPDPSLDGSGWNAGTMHTLSLSFTGDTTNPPEEPNSLNTKFDFSSWSDGGAYFHTTAGIPAASTTYTATVNPSYVPVTNFSGPPCGGTAAITPASTDSGFYPWGTQLTYTATPNAGWTFAGWTFDLTGTSNPATLSAKDETLVYANFNVTNAPLTITSLSPASVPSGSSTFTLTINGTGFTTQAQGTNVVINGSSFPAVTFVSPTEIQVQVGSSLVTNPGTFDVAVENFPPGSMGCAVFAYNTFAVTASGAATITPTINWTPAAEIVHGDAGTTVLNATTTPPDIGNFTYSAAPGSIDITGGTSGLAPGMYTVTATFTPTNPQYTTASATSSLTVAGETVWVVNGAGSLSELTGDGTAVSSSAYAGENTAVAIDSGGNIWTVGSGAMPLIETSQVGTVQNSISATGGLDAPAGVAIDGSSQVWITNGNSTVSLFTDAGTALSPSGGFTDPSLSTPSGIAVDLGGSVWIANKGNSTVTRILGAAAPAAPLSTAAQNNKTGARP